MWAAVFVAVLIALLTAIAYASLSNRYPEAGTGSSYYYAEVAVLHQEEHRHFKFARLSKFIVGWASHLYYWIYPGVMVSNIGTFLLYGMTCIICLIAFAGVAERNVFSTVIAPLLGALLNGAMLIGVLYYAIVGASNTRVDTIVAVVFSVAFLVLGFAFLYIGQLITGIPILHPEDHKTKAAVTRGPDVVITRKLGPLVNITELLALEPSLETTRETEITGPFQLALLNPVTKERALQDDDWDTPTVLVKRVRRSNTLEGSLRNRSAYEPSLQGAGDTEKAIWQPSASQVASSGTAPKEAEYQDNN
jgi:hypothetical protein